MRTRRGAAHALAVTMAHARSCPSGMPSSLVFIVQKVDDVGCGPPPAALAAAAAAAAALRADPRAASASPLRFRRAVTRSTATGVPWVVALPQACGAKVDDGGAAAALEPPTTTSAPLGPSVRQHFTRGVGSEHLLTCPNPDLGRTRHSRRKLLDALTERGISHNLTRSDQPGAGARRRQSVAGKGRVRIGCRVQGAGSGAGCRVGCSTEEGGVRARSARVRGALRRADRAALASRHVGG